MLMAMFSGRPIRARRKILEENMTVVKDRIMFSEIKNIKVCYLVILDCQLSFIQSFIITTTSVLALEVFL